MQTPRRDLLKLAGGGMAASLMSANPLQGADSVTVVGTSIVGSVFPVRRFGAVGDGTTIDTAAVNKAIDAAASAGGGVVHFSAGTYACYSIHLKSNVTLFLDQGATILAAPKPADGGSGGYDAPEPDAPWHAYQDFGHSHWHNSLIWGDGLHDCGIAGPGRFGAKDWIAVGDEIPLTKRTSRERATNPSR